jgi:hypothetical protein
MAYKRIVWRWRPGPDPVPIHTAGGIHDRCENQEKADGPDEESVVFVQEKEVEVCV